MSTTAMRIQAARNICMNKPAVSPKPSKSQQPGAPVKRSMRTRSMSLTPVEMAPLLDVTDAPKKAPRASTANVEEWDSVTRTLFYQPTVTDAPVKVRRTRTLGHYQIAQANRTRDRVVH